MKITEAIGLFIRFLEIEKRYSVHTIISYTNDLTQLKDYLQESYEVDDVMRCSSQHLRSFVVYLLGENLAAKSVNRKVSSTRRFFGFLLKKGIITSDITEKLIPPRIPKRLPEFIKESEAQQMQEWVVEDNFEAIRDVTIVQVFYFTGIRRFELINLKLSDIDFSGHKLKVLGKGSKERYVPVSSILFEMLQNYIAKRIEVFPETTLPFLFLTVKGKKTYPKLIYNIVKQQLTKITTSQKRSPHILRHSFASHLLNNGADLNAIKEILGHANLSATQIYTHNSISKLKEAYRDAHPKSRT